MPMRSSTQPTLSQFTWKRIRGAVTLIKARRSTRFTSRRRSKREELDKILEADSIADDSTIQNAFYDAPTVVYLFAPYTYPNDAQDCCVAKSFTIRQNKPKNPGKYVNFLGAFWMEIFLQFYNAVIIIKTSSAVNSFFAENARSGGWRSKNKKGA